MGATMSEPNMDLWSSQEIMEYRVEKLSKEVEQQRVVIEQQKRKIEALLKTSNANNLVRRAIAAIRDLDGGDK